MECNETPVYLVSVFNPKPDERLRVWGYYHEVENARQCVKENWTDISELGYYRYGIVSKMGVGPLAVPEDEEWYEFCWVDGHLVTVEPVAKPEEYAGVLFGL